MDVENSEAVDVRRQWMRLIGCDEAEISEACDNAYDLSLEDELEQLGAAIRLAQRTLHITGHERLIMNTDVVVSTSAWLRDLGAVRPMAPAAEEVLVLGKWRDGYYPIMWKRYYDRMSRDFNGNLMNREPIENWYLFGVMVHGQLTKAECERILGQLR